MTHNGMVGLIMTDEEAEAVLEALIDQQLGYTVPSWPDEGATERAKKVLLLGFAIAKLQERIAPRPKPTAEIVEFPRRG